MKTIPFNRHMIGRAPGVYAFHCLVHLGVYLAPIGLGLIEKLVFDTISGAAPVTLSLTTLIALFVAVSLAQVVARFASLWGDITFRYRASISLRRNLLATTLRRPGALQPPVPPGEALNRYRSDVGEVADFPLWLPDAAGNLLAFGLAVTIMASINLTITLVICLPLLVLVGVGRAVWSRLLRAYEEAAQAGDRVSGFLAEILGAVQAVKVAGGEAAVVARLTALNQARAQVKMRERMLNEVLGSAWDYTALFGIAVVLLLAGQGLAAGSFSVGDFALFVTYLLATAHLPAYLGTFIGDYRQQAAAIRRLLELAPGEPAQALFAPWPAAGTAGPPQINGRPDAPLLEVCALSYSHPGSGRGIAGIDLTLPAGSLTVITGRVGAGKSTLLRTMLGLLPAQAGQIRWKGELVGDPAAHFRSPHSAYTPQVARLFSETLTENISLGHPAGLPEITAALQTAVFTADLTTMPQGLATVVGPRGIRLSGGQVQRVAAARMLVRNAELIVCDDLSSALDVTTEARLWAQLRSGPAAPTVLAVSHRPALLQQADQVVVLADGRIVAQGRCAELIERSPELRALLAEQVDDLTRQQLGDGEIERNADDQIKGKGNAE